MRRLRTILEYPPPKPKTGWRVWRDVETMNWKAEIYFDGKLRREEASVSMRVMNLLMEEMLDDAFHDDQEREQFEVAELFHEVCR